MRNAATPRNNPKFDPRCMKEKRRPCQHCIEDCIQGPNHFCAVRLSSSGQVCSRCEDHPQESPCIPFPGLDMEKFLEVRGILRRYPENLSAKADFRWEGGRLQYAISKLLDAEINEASDEEEIGEYVKNDGKKESLATRVAVLEAQLQAMVNQVSQSETPASPPERDNATQASNLLPEPKAEPDAALETARVDASKSRKRAGGEVVGQELPDLDSHASTSSPARPAKPKKQRKLPHSN